MYVYIKALDFMSFGITKHCIKVLRDIVKNLINGCICQEDIDVETIQSCCNSEKQQEQEHKQVYLDSARALLYC